MVDGPSLDVQFATVAQIVRENADQLLRLIGKVDGLDEKFDAHVIASEREKGKADVAATVLSSRIDEVKGQVAEHRNEHTKAKSRDRWLVTTFIAVVAVAATVVGFFFGHHM